MTSSKVFLIKSLMFCVRSYWIMMNMSWVGLLMDKSFSRESPAKVKVTRADKSTSPKTQEQSERMDQ